MGSHLQARARRRRARWIAPLAAASAAALAHANGLDGSFHFDDVPAIVSNAAVHDLGGPSPASARWLGELSFAVNYRLGGLDPAGYHVVNVLVHAVNAALVVVLAAVLLRTPAVRRARPGRLVRRWLPLAAGLLFAVHPLATQAVAYVVQRFTSLATLFYLASLVLYLRARLTPVAGPRRRPVLAAARYVLSVAAAAAAMKTKEIAFTLPLVALGCEALLFRRRMRIAPLVPLAATALLVPIAVVARAPFEGRSPGLELLAAQAVHAPRTAYLLTEARVVVRYLRLLLLPAGQNLDPDVALSWSVLDPGVLPSVAVLVAVGVGAAWLVARTAPESRWAGILAFFGVAWVFVTLSVESTLVPIADVMAEHRMYLPLAGASVAGAAALLWVATRIPGPGAPGLRVALALLATAGPLAAATRARNLAWRDEVTLWSDVVAKSPAKARPRRHLAEAYATLGRTDEAIAQLREAVRLAPEVAASHYNLGNEYRQTGRLEDAAREYRDALQLDGMLAAAHANLGGDAQLQGRLDEAVQEYRAAARLDPAIPELHYNLAAIYASEGRAADAAEEYRQAFALRPIPEKLGEWRRAAEAAAREASRAPAAR